MAGRVRKPLTSVPSPAARHNALGVDADEGWLSLIEFLHRHLPGPDAPLRAGQPIGECRLGTMLGMLRQAGRIEVEYRRAQATGSLFSERLTLQPLEWHAYRVLEEDRLEHVARTEILYGVRVRLVTADQAADEPEVITTPEFIDLKAGPPQLPRYRIEQTEFRPATEAQMDECIRKLAGLDGGKTDRQVIRQWGRFWLRKYRSMDTGQNVLEQRFNDHVHKDLHRPRHRPISNSRSAS